MAAISEKITKKVEKLYYKNKLSVQDVANNLNVSIDAVFYCMRKNGFARRKSSESNSFKFERCAPSFKLRKLNSEKLRTLKTIGTMLYWGEGCKSEKMGVVDFANSDEKMVVLFLKFLREICKINEKRLRGYLYLHANQNTKKCIRYWSNITEIDAKQFTKPYIRKDFNENKKEKMPHGLIHIRYADKKLLILIKNWIKEYSK